MARLHAAVAADVQVPALLGGDHADVLALRLGAFARAAGHGELELVRRAQALVAVLQLDRQAHAVLHAVAAPGASRRRISPCAATCRRRGRTRSRRRSARCQMAGSWFTRAPNRSMRWPPVILVYRSYFLATCADHDQLVGRDLAARHARHDRIGAVLLHVGQEAVVGVLQALVGGLEHELVPAGGQDGGHGRLADVAAEARAVFVEQCRRRSRSGPRAPGGTAPGACRGSARTGGC